MSFNSFLKSINRPTLGALNEPEQDQMERLSNIEKKLNIERPRIIKTEPEEQEDGTEV